MEKQKEVKRSFWKGIKPILATTGKAILWIWAFVIGVFITNRGCAGVSSDSSALVMLGLAGITIGLAVMFSAIYWLGLKIIELLDRRW
jgi:hypothetical protein